MVQDIAFASIHSLPSYIGYTYY